MNLWILYALLAALFAAGVAVFGKLGVSGVDSTLATTIRSVVMTLFLIVISLLLGKFSSLGEIDNRTLKFIILTGIAGACSWLFYFLALKTGPATGTAALDRLSVVFVLVLSALFLNEPVSAKSILGVVMMSAGAIILTLK